MTDTEAEDPGDTWVPELRQKVEASPPVSSVNLRDLSGVSDNIVPGLCIRSSQVISREDAQRLGVKTVLDLRRSPVLCKAYPDNTGQLLKHTLFKGKHWFGNLARCHIRLRPSKDPQHNRALPCKRCTAASEELYGTFCIVYHVDMLPMSVALSILRKLPGKMQLRVLVCAAKKETPEPIVAAAIANPDVMGYLKFYQILLRKARLPLARALRIFANPNAAPVLVHCIHGKDRTGLVAMLLLLVCDVAPEAIVQDYVRSELILRESRDNNELISLPAHLTTNEVIAAAATVMEALMEYLQKRWGGAKPYLLKAGLTVEELACIRVNHMRTTPGLAAFLHNSTEAAARQSTEQSSEFDSSNLKSN